MAIKATVYGLAKTKKDIDINEQFRSLMTEVDGTGAVVIDGKNIAADSIYANQIKAGQINADHLRTDAITADHIQVGVVTGDKIKTGILESNNNLSWLNMDDGTFSFGGGRLTYNQNKLSITAEELYIGTSPVVTNEQLSQELDKIESPDFENKVVGLSGNPIFTDKADDNAVVHVEIDGKSVGGGSGKNLMKRFTEVTVVSPSTGAWVFDTLRFDTLTAGKRYVFSANVEVLAGTLTNGSNISVLARKSNGDASTGFVGTTIQNGRIIGTMIALEDTNQIYLYAGTAGYTNGNTVRFTNIQLEQNDVVEATPFEERVPQPDYPVPINSLNNVDVVSSLGKRNIVLGSSRSFNNNTYSMASYNLSEMLEAGKVYTAVMKYELGSDRTSIQPFFSGGYQLVAQFTREIQNSEGVAWVTFKMSYSPNRVPTDKDNVWAKPVLYQMPSNGTTTSKIDWFMIYEGEPANSIHTIAPEDVQPDTTNSTIYKTNISLPEPLRSIGDVKDRLFRDTDGLWKVERNVGYLEFDGTETGWEAYGSTNTMLLRAPYPNYKIGNSTTENFLSSHFKVNSSGSSSSVGDNEIMLQNNGNTFIGMRYQFSTAVLFKEWLVEQKAKGTPVASQYHLATPTIETLPDDLQQKLNNIQSYGSNNSDVFNTKRPYEVNVTFQGYKMRLKPNRAYTMTTNIPDSGGVNFNTFISTGEVLPSHQLNGVSVNYPRTIHTNSNGDISVAVRYGAINDGFQSGTYWIKIQEAPITNYVYTIVKPNHYEENLLEIYPILKDYWYSNVAPLDVPTVAARGNSATEGAIPVFPNQQLLFEKQTTEGDTYWRIVWVNSRGEVISRETPNTNSITMTAPANAYGMRVSFPTESQASIKYTSHAFLPNSPIAEKLNTVLYTTFKTEMWSRNWKLENYTKTEIENRVPIGQMIESIKKDPATARLTGERLHFTGDVLFDKSFHDKLFAESIFTNTLDAREISAARIKTGMLQSKNGLSNLNMDNGTFSFGNGKITYDGNNLVLNVDTLQIKNSSVPTTSQAQSYADMKSSVKILDRNAKKFINPTSFDSMSSSVSGYLVIKTPITSSYMTRLKISGYNYWSGKSNFNLDIGFYAYTTGILNHSYVSNGDFAISKVQVGRDSSGRAVVVIGEVNTSYSYPTISLDEAILSFTSPPDSFKDGWSMEIVTNLSGLSGLTNISGIDTKTNLDETKGKTDAWTFTGTTEINGGKIRADTITAAQIKAGSITSNEIQAGAITADRIAIGDFTNYAAWGKTAQTLPLTIGSLDTTVYRSSKGSIKLTPGQVMATLKPEIEVVAEEEIYFEFWVKTDSNWNGTASNSKIRFGDQSGALLHTVGYNGPKTTWTKFSGSYKVAVSVYSLQISFGNDGTVGNIWIDDIIIRKKTNGSMIVDGSITANHIKANSITIGNLDTTTTNKINNAVTSSDVTTAILSDKQVKDTRSTNQTPNWYWTTYPRQSVQEFKQRATIGAPGTQQFGVLTTDVPWSGSSGGYITQTFRSGDGVYTRTGITTSWTTWSQLDLESRINNAVTTIDGSGITVKDGSFYLQDSTSDTKYSMQSKTNLIRNHGLELFIPRIYNPLDSNVWEITTEGRGGNDVEYSYLTGRPYITTSYIPNDNANSRFNENVIFGSQSGVVNNNAYFTANINKGVGPGFVYTASFYTMKLKNLTGGVPVINVRHTSGNGTLIGVIATKVFPQQTVYGQEKRYSITFTVPASFGKFDLLAIDFMSNNSNWILIDGLQLVLGNTPVQYVEESLTFDALNGQTHFVSVNATDYMEAPAGYFDVLETQRIRPVRIFAGSDLNNITSGGFYFTALSADAKTILNTPADVAFSLTVTEHAGCNQVFTAYQTGNPRTWSRNYYNGSWGPWSIIVDDPGWKDLALSGVSAGAVKYRFLSGMVNIRGTFSIKGEVRSNKQIAQVPDWMKPAENIRFGAVPYEGHTSYPEQHGCAMALDDYGRLICLRKSSVEMFWFNMTYAI